MTNQQALLECYLSGQMSERQWAQHVAEDPKLEALLAMRLAGRMRRANP